MIGEMDKCEICGKQLALRQGVVTGGLLYKRRIRVCDVLSPCFDLANNMLQAEEGPKTMQDAKAFMASVRRQSLHQDMQVQFQNFLVSSPQYLEARQLFDINPAKNHWLGGGFVHRNLLRLVYGLQIPDSDLDVLVEVDDPKPTLNVPTGWTMGQTSMGSPRFITATGRQIDYIYIDNVRALQVNELEPTIENFLTITPLTIQSLVYHVQQQKLLGDLGVEAIKNKQIAVNLDSNARFAANRYNMTLSEYLQSKADSLHKEMNVAQFSDE